MNERPVKKECGITRFDGEGRSEDNIEIAVEAPLRINLNGKSFVTLQCTPEKLEDLIRGYFVSENVIKKIEKAEEFVSRLGFRQCRVRYFRDKVSVEVEKDRVLKAMELQEKIKTGLKEIGFPVIEIDPEGYRMGRMNLPEKNEK